MKNQTIIGLLIAAALIGFLLDQRRQRMQTRMANNDVPVPGDFIRPAVEPTSGAEFFGPPEAVG